MLYKENSLTHVSPVSHFYTPWKRQKTFTVVIKDSTNI